MVAIVLFLLQVVVSLAILTLARPATRAAFMPLHVYGGSFVTALAFASVALGPLSAVGRGDNSGQDLEYKVAAVVLVLEAAAVVATFAAAAPARAQHAEQQHAEKSKGEDAA